MKIERNIREVGYAMAALAGITIGLAVTLAHNNAVVVLLAIPTGICYALAICRITDVMHYAARMYDLYELEGD